jgi:hypothetical protein
MAEVLAIDPDWSRAYDAGYAARAETTLDDSDDSLDCEFDEWPEHIDGYDDRERFRQLTSGFRAGWESHQENETYKD